jgi:hypothetical protein
MKAGSFNSRLEMSNSGKNLALKIQVYQSLTGLTALLMTERGPKGKIRSQRLVQLTAISLKRKGAYFHEKKTPLPD